MVRVYKKGEFNIYSNRRGWFIVHNTRKEFSQGHTHINNYKTAKFVLYMVFYNKIPNKGIPKYLIESMIRISKNPEYIEKLNKLL